MKSAAIGQGLIINQTQNAQVSLGEESASLHAAFTDKQISGFTTIAINPLIMLSYWLLEPVECI